MSAALIQSLTGFGFGLVSVPLLLLLFPARQAILLSMVLSLCSLLLQGVRSRENANWRYIRQLILIGLPGLIGGLILGDILNPVVLKGIVGITLIIYVSFQWVLAEKQPDTTDVDAHLTKPKGFYLAGLFSGLLTGVAGLPGPPVVAVLVNSLPKDKFQATVVWYFILEYSLAISAFLLLKHAGAWLHIVFWDLLLFLVPTIIGFLIGLPIRKLLSETHFKRLVFSLLLVVGFTSAWDTFRILWQ